ncbi:MAG: TlpA family protein disulfide reductase [Minisyncoccia bacterium]
MKIEKQKLILIIVTALFLFSTGLFIYTQVLPPEKCKIFVKNKEKILLPQEAANKALSFINNNLLRGQIKAAIDGEVKTEKNLYKFVLNIQGQKFDVYITRDGELMFPQAFSLNSQNTQNNYQNSSQNNSKNKTTIGYFNISESEICKENNKPIIYFFGSNSCPHCQWEHPLIQEVAQEFKDYISFHDNMGAELKEEDVFSKYSSGGVPTLVLGCKYYREGSGEQGTKEEEKDNLRALICKLTQNKPESVCNKVQNLISQIP